MLALDPLLYVQSPKTHCTQPLSVGNRGHSRGVITFLCYNPRTVQEQNAFAVTRELTGDVIGKVRVVLGLEPSPGNNVVTDEAH